MSDTVSNEVLTTDASNVIVEVVEKTFINIINEALNGVILMKTEIKLTTELIDIIKKIISLSPNTITDVEKAVIEIVKDEKIDTKDIPQLIIVVQKIYQIIYSLKDAKIDAKKRSEFTASVLKFIVHLLVIERKIQVEDEKQVEFLKEYDALIDACIGLLSFPKSIKTKGCLKKLFG